MRYLYVYDPDRKRFTETRDVSNMTLDDRELLRLEMMAAAEFPLEVLDSFEDGFPLPETLGARLAEGLNEQRSSSNC
jgi:hypothetical protein